MRRRRIRSGGLVPALAGLALLPASVASAQAGFEGLGSLPGAVPGSVASDVSADGQVVVGGCPSSATCAEAWRWTGSGGIAGLGFLPGESGSFASATSADGAVVFGLSGTIFRWTSAGMVDIGAGLPAGDQLLATDLSSDGQVAVGGVVDLSTLQGAAWRWSTAAGIEVLAPFTLPVVVGFEALSADGSVIAGAEGIVDDQVAFLRTDAGTTFLPELPSGGCQCSSYASDVSDDGLHVVGSSQEEPFLWSAATGTLGLGFLPGTAFGDALGVSADGSVVVGHFDETVAFVWTARGGLRRLRDVLAQRGLDPTGWDLEQAVAVSNDGTVIVGNGTNPSGRPEAWRAVLPEEPAPDVPALPWPAAAALLAALVLAGARRGPSGLRGPEGLQPSS